LHKDIILKDQHFKFLNGHWLTIVDVF